MTLKALIFALLEMTGAVRGTTLYQRVLDAAPVILREAGRIHPLVVGSVIFRESVFDPDALGAKGERGLMQVNPRGAAITVCTDIIDLWDPALNIRCGVRILTSAIKSCTYLEFGLSRYNGGACRRGRYSEKILSLLPLSIRLAFSL